MDVLQARGLVKEFERTRAVDGVDLEVRAGERVALLGPNGAGKTTTLFMCLGVISADAGSVTIAGHSIPGDRTAAMEKVGFSAGYMPLAERLRVREFLQLYGRLYGVDEVDARIEAALDRFRIGDYVDAMSTELSSGQRTLVGIAKATLHRPVLLVLDEPTASLDPDVARRVRKGLMRQCDEEGTALLITSHNMVEVERLCERVVFLSQGKVVANDAPSAVAARFGREDLEGVFLQLADEQAENPRGGAQETDRP
jgi:ABC-2 type transport system ATP-binding protein